MKTNNFLFFAILLAGICAGCSKDDKDDEIKEFAGHYKIVSIVSSKPVDMNNDGIPSEDILNEISYYHVVNGERVPHFYNPELFLAEVRPLPHHTNDYRFIAFNYPYQLLLNEEEKDEKTFLMCYTRSFYTYTYDLKPNNVVEVTDINPEYTSQFGTIHSVIRTDQTSFEVNMTTRLYDFREQKWVDTNLVVRYRKYEFS